MTGLGLSEGALHVAIHRMRLRLRVCLENEIRETLGSEESFEEELAHFIEVFQNQDGLL